jgi:transcription initiation factor TFIIIB Brf1 subunit/transcription initiation factor TFIIB
MKCLECSSENIQHTDKEIICRDCGLVIDDAFIQNPYISDAQKDRAEHPWQAQAGTQAVSGKIIRKEWLYSHSEKKNRQMSKYIQVMGEKMKLSKKIIEDARLLAHRLQRENLLVGKFPEHLLCGCLYASCLMHNNPRTHLEFELFTKVDRFAVLRAYRFITESVGLRFQRPEVSDLMQIYGNRLKLCPETIHKAHLIWEKMCTIPRIQSKPGYVVASSILYYAAKKEISQAQMAYTSGVREATMRSTLKLFSNCLSNKL